MPLRHPPDFVAAWTIVLLSAAALPAQTWYGGADWTVRRTVVLPDRPEEGEVCVAEFFTHGALTDEQPGVTVVAEREPVAMKVLQRGPGDLLRVAFRTLKGQTRYDIYYDGKGGQNGQAWPEEPGLLMDVRQFEDCDLAQLASVRAAFERAPPLGADYVPNVFIGMLPLADAGTPVLVRYTGTLHIGQAGKYKLYTSSQNASWLRIDDQPVVDWPGRHGPEGEGRHVAELPLSAGTHLFEYVHATPDGSYLAVAAWQPPGTDKIVPIPAEAFGSVRRVAVDRPQFKGGAALSDFHTESLAQAILEQAAPPLIRVRFQVTDAARPSRWNFGDGQTAVGTNVEHLYLLPGEYVVRCESPAARPVESRVAVAPPWARLNDPAAQADVADWKQELQALNAGTLPADALQQLVRVYVELEDVPRAISVGVDGFRKRGRGAVPLDPQASADLVVDLTRLISRGPSNLNEALLLCREGLALQPTGVPGVRLWLVAADLALQLDHRDDCRDSLAAAQRLLAGSAPQEFAVRLALLAGDLARRRGDATGARTAYQAARQQAVSQSWELRERTARDGAFSRSVDDLLRAGDLERAAAMLDDWAVQLPASREDGGAALLRARWRLDSGFADQVILECEDFVQTAPSDPYADQLLLLAARARHRLKHDDEATATLQRLIKEYPGSPLANDARRFLQDGFPPEEAAPPKATSSRRSSSNAEARPPN